MNKLMLTFFDKAKKVTNKMKDETKHISIAEFAGLKFKMYSFIKKRC